jgi:hypothetical protein
MSRVKRWRHACDGSRPISARRLGRFDQAIGDLLVDAQLLPQPGGLGAYAPADLRFRLAQQALGLHQQLVEQLLMTLACSERIEHLGGKGRHFNAPLIALAKVVRSVASVLTQRIQQTRQQCRKPRASIPIAPDPTANK